MRRLLSLIAVLAVAACTDIVTDSAGRLPTPTGLTYELIPSGDPDAPEGVLLSWDDARSARGLMRILLRSDFGSGQLMSSEVVAMKVLEHGESVAHQPPGERSHWPAGPLRGSGGSGSRVSASFGTSGVRWIKSCTR